MHEQAMDREVLTFRPNTSKQGGRKDTNSKQRTIDEFLKEQRDFIQHK